MKRKLWYLLALVCCLNFVACSDDDKDPDPTPGPGEETDWTDYTGAFSGENLSLTGAASSGSVTLEESSNEKAKLTLKNVVADKESLVFDGIEIKESTGGYSFEATETVGETDITVTGTLTPGTRATEAVPTKLVLKVERTIKSDLVGKYSLNFSDASGINTADFRFDVSTGDFYTDLFLNNMMGAGIGQKISNKVDAVAVSFNENGTFDFSWTPVGTNINMTLPLVLKELLGDMATDELLSLLTISYYTEGSNVYMAIDKSVLNLLSLAGNALPIDITDLLEIFEDKGAYYALPIKTVQEENNGIFFYEDKAFLVTVLDAAASFLEQVPDEFAQTIEMIVEAIPTSEKFNLGLGFTKQ